MKIVMTRFMAVSLLWATTGAPGQEPSIGQLAPDKTVLVVAVKDADQTIQKLKETRLWDLWQSEQFNDVRSQMAEGFEEFSEDLLRELGVERDSIQPPSGQLMLSVFATVGEELGLPGLGFLLAADYGEHADKTAELFQAAFDKASEEDDLAWEERQVMGRTVLEFDVSELEIDQDEAGEEGGFDEFGGPGMPDPATMLASIKSIFYVREDSHFILTSDLEAMRGAFESFDGVDRSSLNEREDFQGLMNQLGEDNDLFAALLVRDLGEIAATLDPGGMAMVMVPMLKPYIGDVRGLGLAERIGGDDTMVKSTMSVYMPFGKSGITAMVDTESPRGEVPDFVPAGVVSYSRSNFEFEALPAFVQGIMQFAGPMMGMGAQQGPSVVEMVRQVTAPLGQRIHTFNTVQRPLGPQSQKSLMAIDTTRPQDMENALAQIMAQTGFESRDFLGRRLYTMDLSGMGGGMAPMPGMPMSMPMESLSIGVAGAFTFVGETNAVEQAIRLVGEGEAAGLGEEPGFQRAARMLESDEVVAWGYSDLITAFEAQIQGLLEQARQFEEFKRANPELVDDLEGVEMFSDEQMKTLRSLDFDELRRYIGPSSWEAVSTDDGFVLRSYLLPAGVE